MLKKLLWKFTCKKRSNSVATQTEENQYADRKTKEIETQTEESHRPYKKLKPNIKINIECCHSKHHNFTAKLGRVVCEYCGYNLSYEEFLNLETNKKACGKLVI